jgi:DNA-binding NarL/FixJ family response regulator
LEAAEAACSGDEIGREEVLDLLSGLVDKSLVVIRTAAGGTLGAALLRGDREQEIALLVARGLTNRQISGELTISERTAGNHIAKILKKLGLRSRTKIATWATETKLPESHPD